MPKVGLQDKNIFNFIETHKGITAKQAGDLFYNNHKYSYDDARRRLRKLYDNKLVNRIIIPQTSEYLYYFDKTMSYHNSIVLNFYSSLVKLGVNILYYKHEKSWTNPITNKKFRCDGYFEVLIADVFLPILLEIDHTHKTDIQKYEDIYNTNIFQSEIYNRNFEYGIDKDIFPKIIIITHHNRKYTGNLNIKFLDYNFSDLLNSLLLD